MAGVGVGEAGVVIYRYLPCAIHENGHAEALLDRKERVLMLRSGSLQPGHGGGDVPRLPGWSGSGPCASDHPSRP